MTYDYTTEIEEINKEKAEYDSSLVDVGEKESALSVVQEHLVAAKAEVTSAEDALAGSKGASEQEKSELVASLRKLQARIDSDVSSLIG